MVVSFLGRSINLSDEDVFNGFVSYLRDFFDVENTWEGMSLLYLASER